MSVALGYQTPEIVDDPGDPWSAIWLHPRLVARWALAQPASKSVVWLLLGGAVAGALGANLEKTNTLGQFGVFLALTLVVMVPIAFLFMYFVVPPLLSMVGRLLGGSGDSRRVRIAFAYAQIPCIWGAVVSGLKLVVVLSVLSLGQAGNAIYQLPWLFVTSGLVLVSMVIAIWSYIIFLACLAEAHRFSMWKAFATTALLGLVASVLVVAVIVAVVMTLMRA